VGKDLEMADLEQQQKQEAAEAKKKEKELAKQQKAAEKEAKKQAKAEAKALKQAEKEAKKAEAGIQEDGETVKPKKEKQPKKAKAESKEKKDSTPKEKFKNTIPVHRRIATKLIGAFMIYLTEIYINGGNIYGTCRRKIFRI
jgi:hypothetical protein